MQLGLTGNGKRKLYHLISYGGYRQSYAGHVRPKTVTVMMMIE